MAASDKVLDFQAAKEKRERQTQTCVAEPAQRNYSGTLRCLACKHEWEGVASFGVVDETCPACECNRGIFKGSYEVPYIVRTCEYCGSQHFHITPFGAFCPGCGDHSAILPPPTFPRSA